MTSFQNDPSRRRFIKGLSVLSAAPGLIASAQAANTPAGQAAGYKVLTCNIRVDLPEDDAQGFGWKARKQTCTDIIAAHHPDLIGFQEVLKGQMEDLKKAFPAYQSFGFDGPEMDAYPTGYHGIAKNPIMFSQKRYELITGGTFWLSETPLVAGSLSWETARARHINWVRLKDKKTAKEFRFLNLHLDHKSQKAREEQVKMVMQEAAQYDPAFPQILTGDFNSGADNPVYEQISSNGWTDSYTAVNGPGEPGFTVHLFQGENYPKKTGKKIDFIFTHGNIKSLSSAIIKDNRNGRYPSDHYFVSAELQIV